MGLDGLRPPDNQAASTAINSIGDTAPSPMMGGELMGGYGGGEAAQPYPQQGVRRVEQGARSAGHRVDGRYSIEHRADGHRRRTIPASQLSAPLP